MLKYNQDIDKQMNQKSMIVTAGIVLVVLFMVMQIDQLRELIGLPAKTITA